MEKSLELVSDFLRRSLALNKGTTPPSVSNIIRNMSYNFLDLNCNSCTFICIGE